MSACPNCNSTESSVVRSGGVRPDGRIKRRRRCGGCGLRYYTIELAEQKLSAIEKVAAAISSIKSAILGHG